jgi:hypothetical protein
MDSSQWWTQEKRRWRNLEQNCFKFKRHIRRHLSGQHQGIHQCTRGVRKKAPPWIAGFYFFTCSKIWGIP